MRPFRVLRVIGCAALLVGCTSTIHNDPINRPFAVNAEEPLRPGPGPAGDVEVRQ